MDNTKHLEIENKIQEILKEVFKNLIINTKQTFDLLLGEKNASDLIALYDFYYYTAKWQKTNQPKATIRYVMKGLKWGEKKTRDRKQQLVKLGLVEDVRQVNKKGQAIGWYIKINYIWGENTILDKVKTTLSIPATLAEKPQGGQNHSVVSEGINALSVNSLNALSVNKEHKNNSDSKESPLKRKDFKVSTTTYKEITDAYQQYKGVKLSGAEFGEVKRAIKTMLYSGRTQQNILDFMKWITKTLEAMREDEQLAKKFCWLENWTILTIKRKMPEFLAGKFQDNEEVEIPSYAKKWQK